MHEYSSKTINQKLKIKRNLLEKTVEKSCDSLGRIQKDISKREVAIQYDVSKSETFGLCVWANN